MTHAVAQIRTGTEQAFSERLTECGVVNYCPTVMMLARISGIRRPMKVSRPRFPSYLFVEMATVQFLHPVYQDSRFNGFLRVAHMVGVVSRAEIAALRAYEGREVTERSPVPGFIDGDLAKPSGGVCGGMTGEVRKGNEGQIWLQGYDFPLPVCFTDASALILLESSLNCAA